MIPGSEKNSLDNYNSRRIGNDYEHVAAEFLKSKNYKIIARNFRVRAGEIDIVAQKEEYIVFVEVKYRSNGHTGMPEDAVNYKKRLQISKVALYFLNKYGYGIDIPIRFDVITVTRTDVRHIENAFEYTV